MSIVVFGSINMDLVTRTPRLPAPGETLIGRSFVTVPGGKGANQAVGCARLGASTTLIGRVGGDDFGAALRHNLQNQGVNIDGVYTDTAASGVAAIAVDDKGENTIIVVPGANGRVNTADLGRLEAVIGTASVLLLQLELPLNVIQTAVALASRHRVITILDPAPAQPLPHSLLEQIDILTPNESEAASLVGFPIESEAEAKKAAFQLLDQGVSRVILKMGERGALAADAARQQMVPTFPVTVVDTVAAGDAFNAGLAVALSERRPFSLALRWALAAGALAVTKHGAQNAMPTRDELLHLLETAV